MIEDCLLAESLNKMETTKRFLRVFLAFFVCSIFTGCAGIKGRVVWTKSTQMPLNLTEFFNNDGLSSEANRHDGNFDCPDHPEHIPGSTYPSDSLPQTGVVFSVDKLSNVDFLFPSKLDGSDNNITCAGQKIEVPPVCYSELYVLGSAENGSAEAKIKLDYGGDKQEVPLKFSDWCSPPEFGEIPAFRFDHRHSWQGEEEAKECYLLIQKIKLDPTRKLEYIKLPYNSRIHIFCMTIKLAKPDKQCKSYAEDTLQLYQSLREPKKVPLEDIEPRIARIEDRLKNLREAENHRFSRELQWIEAQIMYCRYKMPRGRKRVASSVIRAFKRNLASIERDVESLARGINPFPAKRGNFLRGYISDIDGNLQTYSLTVPGEYRGDKPFPLVVNLHGHGWYAPFQGHPAPNIKGAIVVSPHGRGSVDYMFIGEEDVLRVINEVKKDYNIAEDRVYLTGHSMGGTGSWNLGVKYPEIFAAIGPVAGNADHNVWKKEWWWNFHRESPFLSLLNYIEDSCDPATYAENLANLPVFCLHGKKDKTVPVGHARSMVEKLRSLGYNLEYREFSRVGHGGFPYDVIQEQRDWLLSKTRNPHPKFVRYKTSKLRYAGSYWLKINQFAELLKFATIEGYCERNSGFSIHQENVSNFTIEIAKSPLLDSTPPPTQMGRSRQEKAKRIIVSVDGDEAYNGPIPSEGVLTLGKSKSGKWEISDKPSGFIKRAGLEGPVEDAFMSPFLVVYGTTAELELERETIKSEAESFVRDWKKMYCSPCRIKKDSQVTDEDIEKYNLILYGAPHANILTARVMEDLPVKVSSENITLNDKIFEGTDVGVKFCYPNPLNRDRYVVIFAATTWRGMYQINTRFGNWFDWGVYDNRNWFDYAVFDDRTYMPETFLCVGFFNQFWQLDKRYQWLGDEGFRAASVPRRIPVQRSPPKDAEEVFLSDLMPTLIDQHKGPVNFDRGFHGGPLRIGVENRIYRKGLGLRAPSIIEFNIGGRFNSFHAIVGVDLEGEKSVSRARADSEWIQFVVYGDNERLYMSDWLQWNSEPEILDVPIEGVNILRLEVKGSGARWLIGSASWADAKVSTKQLSMMKRVGKMFNQVLAPW